MVQTVERNDGKSTTIAPGRTITYQFIDQQTILGEGLRTLPTTSWRYSRSGSRATVELNYSAGSSVERLTFTTPTSGIYRSDNRLNTGLTGWHEGSFTISLLDDSGSGGGSSQPGCETNNTGTITFWVSVADGGTTTVFLQDAGTRSTDGFRTVAPACGTEGTGIATYANVSAGSRQFTARDDVGTWGPATVTVNACDCTLLELGE